MFNFQENVFEFSSKSKCKTGNNGLECVAAAAERFFFLRSKRSGNLSEYTVAVEHGGVAETYVVNAVFTVHHNGNGLYTTNVFKYAAAKMCYGHGNRVEGGTLSGNYATTGGANVFFDLCMVDVRKKSVCSTHFFVHTSTLAIERNKRFYGIPFGFHFIRFWQTVLPVKVFDFFFGKVVGLYNAMDDFKGRA